MKEEKNSGKDKEIVRVSSASDIIDSHPDERAREILTHLLLKDQTTGAGSRLKALGGVVEISGGNTVISGDLEEKVGKAIERRGVIGVCFTDLNNLKKINDKIGHEAGDEYLKHAVSQVRDDEVYRIGGDEILTILDLTGEFSVAKTLAGRVIERGESAYADIESAKNVAQKDLGERTYVYDLFLSRTEFIEKAVKSGDANEVAKYVVEHIAEKAIHRIMGKISGKDFEAQGMRFTPRGPTGMVLYQGVEGDDAREVADVTVRDADGLMYVAKETGKETVQDVVAHRYFDRRQLDSE